VTALRRGGGAVRHAASIAALILAAALLDGCAGRSSIDVLRTQGEPQVVEGEGFRHIVVRRPGTAPAELHVYIEGDGVPYAHGAIAHDPTSRSLLMLHLMSADPAQSLYLGRPCYLGLYADRRCNAHYWTDRRFSPEVVASMRRVLLDEQARTGSTSLILIGHSGGGTLAVLLARALPQVDGVITIGGNLDTDAWSQLHNYAPLTGSENPALLDPLPIGTKAFHLVGSRDRVTPSAMISNAARVIGGTTIIYPGFTHTCCWEKVWPHPISWLHPNS